MRSYTRARRRASSQTGDSSGPLASASCNSARSMPAQKTDPAPVRTTERTAASEAARSNADPMASIRARLRALRLSARLSVTRAHPVAVSTSYRTRLSLMALSREGTQHRVEVFQPLQWHLQQGQRQALTLRIGPQRFARATAQHIEQHEVQCFQVGRLVADHAGRIQLLEVVGDRLAGQVLAQPGVARLGVGDHGDVGMVALVATAPVGNVKKPKRLDCAHGSSQNETHPTQDALNSSPLPRDGYSSLAKTWTSGVTTSFGIRAGQ